MQKHWIMLAGALMVAPLACKKKQPESQSKEAVASGDKAPSDVVLIHEKKYYQGDKRGDCKGPWHGVMGYHPKPKKAGEKFPVYLFFNGTATRYNNKIALQELEKIAQKGYLAVSVGFNSGPLNFASSCEKLLLRTQCAMDEKSYASAAYKICHHPAADCSLGLYTHGISQGANIAILAKNFHSQVVAALADSPGDRVNRSNFEACINKGRKLPQTALRITMGEQDEIVGRSAKAGAERYEFMWEMGARMSGRRCVDEKTKAKLTSCYDKTRGHGFSIIKNEELGDGLADHCWMLEGGCKAIFNGKMADRYLKDDPSRPWSQQKAIRWLFQQKPGANP